MAIMTWKQDWTGKVELIELSVPGQPLKPEPGQLSFRGLSMRVSGLDAMESLCLSSGVPIMSPCQEGDRAFDGPGRRMVIQGPGGVILELVEVL